ncbi:hypothetical protein GCM10010497_09570 [Streptomyces cinereoruber]|uniref:PH domain-containing protein n=1 Tax=Streptomyces cinereoruber TaxID=67260 RepID=A0AAV4KHD1_9ACTN|nr:MULTISPECIES: hypothetical protein [Streptomyces]AVH96138.1 hypothetical protein C5L38_14495 [Streptomyces sp. WAC00288]KYG54797.1 hypothetical protein AWI43_10280 [Streptomyces sp. WAC04657]MBB4156856.1 hypothetical protein [Streptomyces cinereoruber]MBY8815321.1 hypothetical protein [Streptomyces cinereoruber]NIH60046.1 hypothetical protein [Streptomyces cinereoruber]
MTTTGKRRVLYRQGTGFWRMTAKWALVFGALYLLDGGLIRSWGDALVWPMIGILLWVPFGIGGAWYPRKDHLVTLTTHELRVRRKRLPMDRVNLLHVARLWLEGRSTADDRPVAEWTRSDRVVWVPLHDGRAYGVEFRDPAAFARIFGDFAVAACGGPEAVRARAATTTYPDPRPMRARSSDNGSWADLLDLFD